MHTRRGLTLIYSFILCLLSFGFIFASSSAQSFETTELTDSIVHKKTFEVFKTHCLYHKMESELIERQTKGLIESIDPLKIYFLEDEILEWTKPSAARVVKLQNQWSQGDFSELEKLGKLMKQAIQRRSKLEENLQSPSDMTESKAKKRIKDLDWAKTESELSEHLALMRFLENELLSHWSETKRPLARERMNLHRAEFENRFTQTSGSFKNPLRHFMLETYLRVFAQSLDCHTLYFTSQEAQEFTSNVNRKITGIGVLLRDNLDGYTILRIVEGSPTERCGKIKVGDRIIAVDGVPVIGMELSSKGIHLIQGTKDSEVQITLQRDPPKDSSKDTPAQTFEVTIVRDDIVMKENRFKTRFEPYGDGVIGIIELFSFYSDKDSGCAEDVKREIEGMKQQYNLEAVVLDLRHNLGGLLVEAVELSSLFLHPGVIVSAKDSNGQIQTLRNFQDNPVWEGPLFVLVSKSSASSSEIVASALQDWGRALILGDPHSFGKGSFFVFPLNSKKWDPTGVFSITQGLYYTASGKSPQFGGVESDIVVAGPMANLEIGEKTLKYPLPTSHIEPLYKDDLRDVTFIDKLYLEKNYLPLIQEPKKIDGVLVEKLKKNSEARQSQSPYSSKIKAEKNSTESEEMDVEEPAENNMRPVQTQWQLEECLNIVKDWLYFNRSLAREAA